jgi:hypothetical protein
MESGNELRGTVCIGECELLKTILQMDEANGVMKVE